MIKCHVSRLMGERRVRVADVARDTGLHRNLVGLLWQGEVRRIEIDALNSLCAYFGVPVGEIFEYVADPTDGSPVVT
ncbi:MAG TPA: helix-turn-helix transcriptional regulator [Methylibium sp.]|uniref:helix-turn-helix domain-containing protein n=1 Tax=Methylibium sp. TaxID=2067992 RepID=UPI002DBE99B8|nr:helix-turn-helix transcriptional regulator [Methylibium sp.]HEU4460881.1 helix-turn-helix transcriptional regulator [Methylibium sp.]